MSRPGWRAVLWRLGRWLAHPVWRVTTNGVLLATALFELLDTSIERRLGVAIRLSHGVIFYAIAQVLEHMGEIAANWIEWRERKEKKD